MWAFNEHRPCLLLPTKSVCCKPASLCLLKETPEPRRQLISYRNSGIWKFFFTVYGAALNETRDDRPVRITLNDRNLRLCLLRHPSLPNWSKRLRVDLWCGMADKMELNSWKATVSDFTWMTNGFHGNMQCNMVMKKMQIYFICCSLFVCFFFVPSWVLSQWLNGWPKGVSVNFIFIKVNASCS